VGTHEITITGVDSAEVKAKFRASDAIRDVKHEFVRQTGALFDELGIYLETREEPADDDETIEALDMPLRLWMVKKGTRVEVATHMGKEPAKLTYDDVETFCKTDGKTTNIIDLANCTAVSAAALDLFKECTCLQELVLSGCELDAAAMQAIASLLEGNEVLHSLNLCNASTEEFQSCFDHQGPGCEQMGPMECVVHGSDYEDCEGYESECDYDFVEAPLVTRVISAIAENCGALTELNLSGNGLATINRGEALAKMLSTNTSLETLNISANTAVYPFDCGCFENAEEYRIIAAEEDGTKFICALSLHWIATNETLTHLDISSNTLVEQTEDGVFPEAHILQGRTHYVPDFEQIIGFFDALHQKKALKHLNIADIGLGGRKLKSIYNWKLNNGSSYKVVKGEYGAAGIEALARLLEANTSLTNLNVSSNWLGPGGLALLANDTARLQTLDISSNRVIRGQRKAGFDGGRFEDAAFDVDLVGVTALIAAVDGSSSLTTLSMGKNSIPDAVQAQMMASCDLKRIALDCNGIGAVNENYPSPDRIYW
jgi:Leucine-rich repeat (LRR) protein